MPPLPFRTIVRTCSAVAAAVRGSRKWLFASAVFATTSSVTLAVWQATEADVLSTAGSEFQGTVRDFLTALDRQVAMHEQVLRGASAATMPDGMPEGTRWRRYAAGLRAEAVDPGLLAIGVTRTGDPAVAVMAALSPAAALPEIAHVAARVAAASPGHALERLAPALYVMSFAGVPPAAVPGREASAAPARDVRLFALVTAESLFRGALEALGHRDGVLDIDVHDADAPADARPVFRMDRIRTTYPAALPPAFSITREVEQRGVRWRVAFHSPPYIEVARNRDIPRMILVGGLLFSGLLAGLAWTVSDRRARALRLAQEMTRRLRESEAELAREKELAEITLSSIGDAVITTARDGSVVYCNPVAATLTGRSAAAARGRPLREVLPLLDETTRAPVFDPGSGEQVTLAWFLSRPVRHALLAGTGGRMHEIKITSAPIHDADGAQAGIALVFCDVTVERDHARRIEHQATHDALTGLANRREFERLGDALIASARETGRFHALAVIDLDRFKPVNDTCGHDAGDALLRQLAALMRSRLRQTDTLARTGGDEFAVLLEGCDIAQAQRIAQAICDAVRDHLFRWNGRTFRVGASIGLVAIPREAPTLAAAIAAADAACYVAKARGRGQVVVDGAGEGMAPSGGALAPASDWTRRIADALCYDHFELHVQFASPARPETTPGVAKILLRMAGDSGRSVPAMAFLPAAERNHLMPLIDLWVLERTIAHLGRRPKDRTHCLFVTLSSQTIASPTPIAGSLDAFLAGRLHEHGVAPAALGIALPEPLLSQSPDAVKGLAIALHELGCRISIEQFTGSVWSLLRDWPVDFIRVDPVLVRGFVASAFDRAQGEAIVRMAGALGIRTVADGIDDVEARRIALELGFDHVQGYAIGRPQPLASAAHDDIRSAVH
jgi:diguanylate cyclase (GGDEF)-like protein